MDIDDIRFADANDNVLPLYKACEEVWFDSSSVVCDKAPDGAGVQLMQDWNGGSGGTGWTVDGPALHEQCQEGDYAFGTTNGEASISITLPDGFSTLDLVYGQSCYSSYSAAQSGTVTASLDGVVVGVLGRLRGGLAHCAGAVLVYYKLEQVRQADSASAGPPLTLHCSHLAVAR